jgi:hypothetical protein
MAMIIENRHVLRVGMIQLPGGIGLEKEVFGQKIDHGMLL